jgi:hypothetical protein
MLREISTALSEKEHVNPPIQTGYDDFLSTEKEAARIRKQYAQARARESDEHESFDMDGEKLEDVESGTLPREVEKNLSSMTTDSIRAIDTEVGDERLSSSNSDPKAQIEKLRADFMKMKQTQGETLHSIFTAIGNSSSRKLNVEERLPSLLEKYGQEPKREDSGSKESSDEIKSNLRNRFSIRDDEGMNMQEQHAGDNNGGTPKPKSGKRTTEGRVELEQHQKDLVERSDLVQLNRSLSTVYTLFFSTEYVPPFILLRIFCPGNLLKSISALSMNFQLFL